MKEACSFTCAIFRAVFDPCSSFFAPKPHRNACYAGYSRSRSLFRCRQNRTISCIITCKSSWGPEKLNLFQHRTFLVDVSRDLLKIITLIIRFVKWNFFSPLSCFRILVFIVHYHCTCLSILQFTHGRRCSGSTRR